MIDWLIDYLLTYLLTLLICRWDEQLERRDETARGKEHVIHTEDSRLGRGNWHFIVAIIRYSNRSFQVSDLIHHWLYSPHLSQFYKDVTVHMDTVFHGHIPAKSGLARCAAKSLL